MCVPLARLGLEASAALTFPPSSSRSASSRTPTATRSSPAVRLSLYDGEPNLGGGRTSRSPLTPTLLLPRTARIHAFCGGLAKNPDGTWTNGGAVTDYTKQVVKKSFSSTVSVKGSPISLAECKAFKKKHPKYVPLSLSRPPACSPSSMS